MSSKIISGETSGVGPMPWHTAAGTVAPARRSPAPASGTQQPHQGLEADLAQFHASLAHVEAEKGRMIKEARDAGRREGEAAGRQAAESEVRPVLERLAAALKEVSELPARLRVQAEGDLVQLAVAIAQRILQREVTVDPAVITGLVRVGLEKVRKQDVLRVRVCPNHHEAVKDCLALLGATHVEVISDPGQERGGVIFETSRGKLDVSIGTQLREIERGLTDRLRGQG